MVSYFTLHQIAQQIGGTVIGDNSTVITSAGSAIQGAPTGSITYIENPKLLPVAEATEAAAIIVPASVLTSTKPILIADNPRLCFAQVLRLFYQEPLSTGQIHPQCCIHPSSTLGQNVSVHPFAVISEGCSIGDHCIIGPGTYIGKHVQIGNHSIIRANAVIESDTFIGSNVIVHGGSVIGGDGFGFITTENGHIKIPHVGNVIIEDDVEIYTNVTIDRGTVGSTVIGKGSRLGDLVHVGHNAQIGEQCILVAQVVVGGSTKLGRRVTMAGKSGVTNHVTVGNYVTLAANSIILKNTEDNQFLSGHPAIDHKKDYRIKAAERKLPEMLRQISELQKRVAELEKESEKP